MKARSIRKKKMIALKFVTSDCLYNAVFKTPVRIVFGDQLSEKPGIAPASRVWYSVFVREKSEKFSHMLLIFV